MIEQFPKKKNLIVGINSTGKTNVLNDIYKEALRKEYKSLYISSDRINIKNPLDKIQIEEVLQLFNGDAGVDNYIDEINNNPKFKDNKIEKTSTTLTKENIEIQKINQIKDNSKNSFKEKIESFLDEEEKYSDIQKYSLIFLQVLLKVNETVKKDFEELLNKMEHTNICYDKTNDKIVDFSKFSQGYKSLVLFFSFIKMFDYLDVKVNFLIDEIFQGLDDNNKNKVLELIDEYINKYEDIFLIATTCEYQNYRTFINWPENEEVFNIKRTNLISLGSDIKSIEKKYNEVTTPPIKLSSFLTSYLEIVYKINNKEDVTDGDKELIEREIKEIENLEKTKYRFYHDKIEKYKIYKEENFDGDKIIRKL